ncbi:GNAT family N-acetyltransferase [Streptomonospora wellingtoniae]|uniref:GNAT family N-acetyltransferase n=1 Tax=Streptomonospora wellingtoniae TaxID=3075544 RepID=A0ABU2KWH2_9ACTN|nr:GNAT family N-acetyltransferase [Streptomonospora sp. DSM 45055]MDT0303647.1 GNAT family N-acetyltransferase [Streptomonospora sp. DSM 45055]
MRSGAWWAQRVAEDWPAAEVELRAGWRLAWSDGVTRRANSAVCLEPGAPIGAVEEFYRERGSAPCVQIWPGDGEADGRLALRGYGVQRAAQVMVRDLVERPPEPHRADVTVTSRPDDAWRALWGESGRSPEHVPALHRILDRAPAVGYGRDPSGAARGCAVLNGRWAGVYAMATRPADRGRGLAGAVLESLLEWAGAEGAEHAYLLVEQDNPVALRVYERAGFAVECAYGYRVGTAEPYGPTTRTG